MAMDCVLLLLLTSRIANSHYAITKKYDIYPKTECQKASECLTLSHIVNKSEKYFTPNSTLVFHDGDHILKGEVVSVSNINNFTLQGYSGSGASPTIACVNSSFSFSGVSIIMKSIGFNYCSIKLWQSTAVVQDSRFENSRAIDGGALAIHHSNVHFDGANSLTGSTAAEEYGGAVYSLWSNLTSSGSIILTDNKAISGGAVYCDEGNSLRFDGVITFTCNTADYHGGAVCALKSNTLSFNGNSRFVNNTVGTLGGAVFAMDDNTVSFGGNDWFARNTAWEGGAVAAWNGNALSFSGNSRFTNNTSLLRDGALYVWNSTTVIFNGISSFMHNTADFQGGAIYALGTNTLRFNGSSSFMRNAAQYGGAVFASDKNYVSFNDIGLTFSRSTAFAGNSAVYFGGAVYCEEDNTLSFDVDSTFVINTASYYGGAVYAWYGNILSFNENSNFMSNTANKGTVVQCMLIITTL